MQKRNGIGLAAVVIPLFGVLTWEICNHREPVYGGKGLSDWLSQYRTNHWSGGRDGELDKEAVTAIRQVGGKAIPIYLRMMTLKDSPLKIELIKIIPKPWLDRIPFRSVDFEYRLRGASGLVALGANSKPAVHALIDLVSDKNPDVRHAAVFALVDLGPVAADALPALIKCLKDSDYGIQLDAILGLGTLRREPDRVVAILLAILNDNSPQYPKLEMAKVHAIWALRQLGAQAKSAVPTLVRLLSDPNESIRDIATNALHSLDPDPPPKQE